MAPDAPADTDQAPGVYVVPGGSFERDQRYLDTRITAGGVHELLREAYRALPDVAELELVEANAGLRPTTPDNLPLIGAGEVAGLLLATGHYRNGILLAPVTAERIAEMLESGRPEPVAEVAAR